MISKGSGQRIVLETELPAVDGPSHTARWLLVGKPVQRVRGCRRQKVLCHHIGVRMGGAVEGVQLAARGHQLRINLLMSPRQRLAPLRRAPPGFVSRLPRVPRTIRSLTSLFRTGERGEDCLTSRLVRISELPLTRIEDLPHLLRQCVEVSGELPPDLHRHGLDV